VQYIKLGKTGLDISRICLGCMSFGNPERSLHPWILDEEKSRPFIKHALDLGINFFDMANSYSNGTCEEIVGKALKDYARRDEIVIATKVLQRMRPGPNGEGLSRKAIMTEIDASLKRLGTDYIDLYQIHRWDYQTPIEETLEALHDVVKAGKARYLGASSMFAWQFAKALALADRRGWTRFSTMQNYVNLLYREEEREMLPLCKSEGIGVVTWSPLARGRLARDPTAVSARSEQDWFAKERLKLAESDHAIIERVAEVAASRGTSPAQVALAWLLSKPPISAPIIGATRIQHLDEAVAALSLKLSDEDVFRLEELYVPHAVAGF